MEGKKQQRFVIIDGKRYLISIRNGKNDLARTIRIAELSREMEARKQKIREEMEVLGSDHAKISTLYVTPEQMVMYAEMGLWQCKFCEEGFMGHMDHCPKCGCGPDEKEPDMTETLQAIWNAVGSRNQIKNQE